MKTLATLVLVTTAAFAVTPAAQANELILPSVNTQAVSVLAAELMSQQMAECVFWPKVNTRSGFK